MIGDERREKGRVGEEREEGGVQVLCLSVNKGTDSETHW